MNEVWEPWVVQGQTEKQYRFVAIEENIGSRLCITLSTADDKQELWLTWNCLVNSWMRSDEESKCLLSSNESIPAGTFFKVRNSKYLDWLKEQSGGLVEYAMAHIEYIHFSIICVDAVLDIVAPEEPRITVQGEGLVSAMPEKYLPIGSVVLLKEGKKRLMIYGRRQRDTAANKEFDYLGCLYPEGNIDKKFNYLFNHRDIVQVFHLGCDSSENTAATKRLLRK
jgi:hypothetical protein